MTIVYLNDSLFYPIDDPWEAEKPKEKEKPKEGTCPKCGHKGEWVRMALKCPEHGVFAGC